MTLYGYDGGLGGGVEVGKDRDSGVQVNGVKRRVIAVWHHDKS